MNPRRIIFVLKIGFVVAAFFAVRRFLPSLNLSFAQLLIFPLVLFLFLHLRFLGLQLPKFLVLISGLAAMAAFVTPYVAPPEGPVVFVSTLQGDDIESESRVFWQELNELLRVRGIVQAARFYRSFSGHDRAKQELSSDKRPAAVVWGSKSRIGISFPDSEPVSLEQAGIEAAKGSLGRLQMVTGIPVIGLSYQPRYDSAVFAAALLSGVESLRASNGLLTPAAETELRYAAERSSFWTSFAHRAFPWFLLGNAYLRASFGAQGLQPALLKCAEQAYGAAAGNMRLSDNPELFAAIHNNLAVLYYLKAYTAGKRALAKLAKRKWILAARARLVPNPFKLPYQAAYVAKRNLLQVRSERFEKKAKKIKAQRKRRKMKKLRERGGRHVVRKAISK